MADEEDQEPQEQAGASRDKDYSGRKEVKDHLLKLYDDIEKGFIDQNDRVNETMDYWDIYNCKLGPKQFYTGTSKIFVPIVYNAINARKTRFVNQFFPSGGRHIEVVTEDGSLPHAEMALAEHYVRKAGLRAKLPALLKNGDIEGHLTAYVYWKETERDIVMRVKKPVSVNIDDMEVDVDEEEPVEDVKEETINDAWPDIEIIADADLVVLPATADSPEDAIASGGSVTIARRVSKAQLQKLIDAGDIDKKQGEALIKEMSKKQPTGRRYVAKEMVEAAGIKGGTVKHALIYETWTKVKLDDGRKLCRVFFGGPDKLLGCKRNPLWCDRLPIVSAPLEKIAGSFRGQSKVKFCADMQYAANDAVNEGMDSAAYALMPIVMTDPAKNPRVGSMVLAQAAIWETNPNDTQFAQFPQLWTSAFEIVNSARQEISSVLSLNPASITQQTNKGKKLNQAEMAAEQQIDILTTADVVTVLEESIMTPIVRLFMELDHQYRDKDITVREYGSMGVKANMKSIPPLQMDRRYQFRWFGVEQQRAAQQVQMQIGALNVIRGIPPQQYPGYQLDLTPVITHLVEVTFGPRLAPLIFKNMAEELSVEIEMENQMLAEGFTVPTHPMDNDKEHIQKHMAAMQEQGGDPTGMFRSHIMQHQQQLQMKQQAAMMQQMKQQQAQGGGGAPGGGPKPGAIPAQPRGGQQPPGAIHSDRLQDPGKVPR